MGLGGVGAAAGGSGALRVFLHLRLLLQYCKICCARVFDWAGAPARVGRVVGAAVVFSHSARFLLFLLFCFFCFFLLFLFIVFFRRVRSVFRIFVVFRFRFFVFDFSFLTFVRCVLLASFLRGLAMGLGVVLGSNGLASAPGRALAPALCGGAIRCGLTRC